MIWFLNIPAYCQFLQVWPHLNPLGASKLHCLLAAFIVPWFLWLLAFVSLTCLGTT